MANDVLNRTGLITEPSPSTPAVPALDRAARRPRVRHLMALVSALVTMTTTTGSASAGPRPFGATLEGQSTVVPINQCELAVTEAGTGTAVHMVRMAWAASERLNLCTNPDGGADAEADFVITAANGDQVFGRYVSVVRLDPQTGVFTFAGRWQIAGGTGRFRDAVGEGTLVGAGRLTSRSSAQLTANFVGTISY